MENLVNSRVSSPPSRGCNHRCPSLRPIMKDLRVEICPVRPDKIPLFAVQLYLREYPGVLQGTVELPLQNIREVNNLSHPVVKLDFQGVWRCRLETDDLINSVNLVL